MLVILSVLGFGLVLFGMVFHVLCDVQADRAVLQRDSHAAGDWRSLRDICGWVASAGLFFLLVDVIYLIISVITGV